MNSVLEWHDAVFFRDGDLVRDFTVTMYNRMIEGLNSAGYEFQTFRDFLNEGKAKGVILRHDVDKLPHNALRFANLEKEMGVRASYYFRIVKGSFDPVIIKQIESLGHEIGYHYEDMDLCKGDIDKAYHSFRANLEIFRKLTPISTVCMHGSPMSQYDNRDMWGKHSYKADGIIGEPYFDIDYNKMLYITDTGRKWNNSEASIRDKVTTNFNIEVKSTRQLIHLAKTGQLPDRIMINTHPQRWTNNMGLWVKELVWQGIKNQVKRLVIKKRVHAVLRG